VAATPKQQPNARGANDLLRHQPEHLLALLALAAGSVALNCLTKIVFREDGCYGDLTPSASAVLLIPSRGIGVPKHMVQA
jgi:hypothetical protein